MPPDSDSWAAWQKLVLARLEDHGEALERVRVDTQRIHVDLETLKVKTKRSAMTVAAVVGSIPAVAAVLLKII